MAEGGMSRVGVLLGLGCLCFVGKLGERQIGRPLGFQRQLRSIFPEILAPTTG